MSREPVPSGTIPLEFFSDELKLRAAAIGASALRLGFPVPEFVGQIEQASVADLRVVQLRLRLSYTALDRWQYESERSFANADSYIAELPIDG